MSQVRPNTVARCVETWLRATGAKSDISLNKQILTGALSSALQAVRSQVRLLLLQDILQASCEGWPEVAL